MIKQASLPATRVESSEGPCCHYWIIEAYIGPTSMGVCRGCEETREFRNYIEEAPQVDDEPAGPPGAVEL